ncbi:LppP/LprE family lipoprotein [Streptomyces sp. JJ66]|uniref:LppP/LprE family lipoprotein n=1 Tax=Streptomyces sp. JJ66 TaxID=2803843 RepID=UPI001C571CC7|nr:LppP/LprE family lipoprotein [Streptomyces sp. JJ66]MBW1604277.1 LppP/LprE family lipoprotein [Streptomyces sp. JJ66]
MRPTVTLAWALVTLGLLVFVLSGCAAGGGVRVEQADGGEADTSSQASPLPAATPSPGASGEDEPAAPAEPEAPRSADPSATVAAPVSPPGADEEVEVVSLLKGDPAVGREVKEGLSPCVADAWPIDIAYGQLTGEDAAADLVVNVSTCADGHGLGSYVYQQQAPGEWRNVFAHEGTASYAEIADDALTLHQPIYLPGDALCCPSGEDVVTYRWRDGGFHELDRVYQEYPEPTGSQPGAEKSRDPREED